jgi:hypothetical protein
METSTKVLSGVIVALLVSMGFMAIPDNATHICIDTKVAMKCDRLSSTGNTCYPTASTTIGKKSCSTGWEKISDIHSPHDVTGKPVQSNLHCYPEKGYCKENGLISNPEIPI